MKAMSEMNTVKERASAGELEIVNHDRSDHSRPCLHHPAPHTLDFDINIIRIGLSSLMDIRFGSLALLSSPLSSLFSPSAALKLPDLYYLGCFLLSKLLPPADLEELWK